ncbi:hypothetical protein C942_02316 [Photobacterium marinum]|uniref:AAA domain-containing protein n=1 Tax=Photobacterium marinum TaxID=1056511 RepID=L8J8U0_9GAMM|nr:ParA family protein [Photobacterium marinum]ELR64623.1 hypothetical protein C942_02316 [Photobacterium marinum]
MIISVAHQKGGVGKTTLLYNLAAIIKPDLIIDLDPHDGLTILNRLRDQQYNVASAKTDKELIGLIKEYQDKTVMIDCGGFDSGVNRIAVAASNVTIVPIQYESMTERVGLNGYTKVLSEISENVNRDITAHVLYYRQNSARKDFSDTDSFIERSKHLSKFTNVLPGRAEYNNALNKHHAVVEHTTTRGSRAARELHAFVDELLTIASIDS